MKNTKRSITFKVIIGYILVATMAALAVWFIYSEVVKFSNLTQTNSVNNQQLYLVSEIATNLYETESTSRRLIQLGDTSDLTLYKEQINSIQNSIDSLRLTYADTTMKIELDSISFLLSQKTSNLEELLSIRSQNRNTSYYSQVLEELQKVSPTFQGRNYEQRFANLEPHQRNVLIKLLEFSREENEDEMSNITADSLITSVKNVLTQLESSNKQIRDIIYEKENELLANDLILNQQLRNLLAVIETEERITTLQRAEAAQDMLQDTSKIIIAVGTGSILIILIFLILIVRDVSKSQRYRIQLEDAKKYTETLLKSREQFMATITHDLRSPLNTLIGYTELINNTSLDNKQGHYLSHLKKSSNYILRLVNDLLDFSKLEAGKMGIEKLPFNPKQLTEETLFNAVPVNDEKDLKLILNASPETDCNVLSDPFRLKQVLSNLITNAYKFTKEGEIIASVSMKKEIEDSYILIISIKDTGIGISEEKQEEIFEEFSQENSSIERNYGGTGLGLAITKRITKLLKGTVSLVSSPGKGSEFIVKIPVVKLPSTMVIPEIEPEINIDLSGKKALIVDDESSQSALTKELLKSIGIKCDTAIHGEAALKKLEESTYHLILTDIQMPVMNGFELVKEIKLNPTLKNIPVIALSGRTNVTKEEYLNAGFSGNLIKPYTPVALLNLISETLKISIVSKKSKSNHFSQATAYSLNDILIFSGDDKTALNTILEAFIDSTKQNLIEIEEAAKTKNIDYIAKIAHRMLPMFKQIKANNIVPTLVLLEEKDCEKLDSKEINKLKIRIEKLLEQLQKEIIA